MRAYVNCFSHWWRSSIRWRVITLFTLGLSIYFSYLVIRMNRFHIKSERIRFSFAHFFSNQDANRTFFPFAFLLFIWERDCWLSSFMWLLISHRYLLRWQLSMSSDVLSNLWCKLPWFWHFELMYNDIPEVFSADIKQAGAITYSAPHMLMHDFELT